MVTGDNGITPVIQNGVVTQFLGDFAAGTAASVVNDVAYEHFFYQRDTSYGFVSYTDMAHTFEIVQGDNNNRRAYTGTPIETLKPFFPRFTHNTNPPSFGTPGMLYSGTWGTSSLARCFSGAYTFAENPLQTEFPDLNNPLLDENGNQRWACLIGIIDPDQLLAGTQYTNGFMVVDTNAGEAVKSQDNIRTMIMSNEDCAPVAPTSTPTRTPTRTPTLTPTNTPIAVCPTSGPTTMNPLGGSSNGVAQPGNHTISWNAVNGATSYLLRVDDLSIAGFNCTTVAAGELCANVGNTTSRVFNFQAGRQYRIWVHPVTSCGNGAQSAVQTITIPGPSPTASATPVTNAPVCVNVTLQNLSTSAPTDPINIGHIVSLRCSQVTGATRYEFRLTLPNGQVMTLQSSQTTPTVSQQHAIAELGSYSAFCRPCANANESSCAPWEQ